MVFWWQLGCGNMNIFVLDTNPSLAAAYHCDQHLHKMILESAQMLSTVARHYAPKWDDKLYVGYYKPTHHNHPCTEWLRKDLANCAWLIDLAYYLNDERLSVANTMDHASMQVIKMFAEDFIRKQYNEPSSFVFAGPLQISIRPDLNTVQKYREYYKLKNAQWIKDGKPAMTWNGRTKPEWMME